VCRGTDVLLNDKRTLEIQYFIYLISGLQIFFLNLKGISITWKYL